MNEPLEIIEMDDIGYFSSGHHDEEAFIQAVLEYEASELGLDEGPLPVDEVRHVWWREIPSTGRFDVEYEECQPSDDGAFPATVVYI